MLYEYSAQNHDWDLTLHAAAELIKAGLIADKQPRAGTLSMGFSFFTGGMVLSFAAIESFSASVAFSMPSHERFSDFDFLRLLAVVLTDSATIKDLVPLLRHSLASILHDLEEALSVR